MKKKFIRATAIGLALTAYLSGCSFSSPHFAVAGKEAIRDCSTDLKIIWHKNDRSLESCDALEHDGSGGYLLTTDERSNRKTFELKGPTGRTFVDGDMLHIYDYSKEMRPGWYSVTVDRRSWWTPFRERASTTGWHRLSAAPDAGIQTRDLPSGIYHREGNQLKLAASPDNSIDALDVIPADGTYFIAPPGYGLWYSANLATLAP